MTERGPRTGIGGAPNPAEPSHPGDAPAPAPVASAAGGRPVAADLAAVRRTDALIESLAARRAPGPPARPADDADPAVRLLSALITDVDDQAAGGPAPPAPSTPRRRGPRTIVALGVAGAVLASTGVAAAGGGVEQRSSATPAPSSSSGQPGPPAAGDVDAATHDRPRPPARPEPVAASQPSRDPERADIERIKRRLEHLFPPRHHRGRPDVPTSITRSAPSDRPDAGPRDDDLGRRLDALRREAEKRAKTYKNPHWDD